MTGSHYSHSPRKHARICLECHLTTQSIAKITWRRDIVHRPRDDHWYACARPRGRWRVATYYPCRTHSHSALSHCSLLETLFSPCTSIVAELSAAPIKSSPVVPPCSHQSPAPRQTRSSCPLPCHRRGSRRGLWSVDGLIWGADETRKEILKHWQSKPSQSHLVQNGSHMNAWNQTRPSAVRGRWSAA